MKRQESKLSAAWESVKKWSYKWLGGLVMDNKSGILAVSIGRCGLLYMLAMLTQYWLGWGGEEMAPGMMEVFYTFSGYVLGGKGVDAMKTKWGQ